MKIEVSQDWLVKQGRRVVILQFAVLIVLAITVCNQRNNSIKGCERLNRTVVVPNAEGWRIAQEARTAAYRRDHYREDKIAADSYDRIAASLEAKAALKCSSLYPAITIPGR